MTTIVQDVHQNDRF